MPAIVSFLLTVIGAADTACSESGHNLEDGQLVLQVVENRRRSNWRRYRGDRLDALFKRHQHAHGCRPHVGPVSAGHLRLGIKFAMGRLGAPAWAERAIFYCGNYDGGICEARGGRLIGQSLHRFYR